jgi:hypothetical protein
MKTDDDAIAKISAILRLSSNFKERKNNDCIFILIFAQFACFSANSQNYDKRN